MSKMLLRMKTVMIKQETLDIINAASSTVASRRRKTPWQARRTIQGAGRIPHSTRIEGASVLRIDYGLRSQDTHFDMAFRVHRVANIIFRAAEGHRILCFFFLSSQSVLPLSKYQHQKEHWEGQGLIYYRKGCPGSLIACIALRQVMDGVIYSCTSRNYIFA